MNASIGHIYYVDIIPAEKKVKKKRTRSGDSLDDSISCTRTAEISVCSSRSNEQNDENSPESDLEDSHNGFDENISSFGSCAGLFESGTKRTCRGNESSEKCGIKKTTSMPDISLKCALMEQEDDYGSFGDTNPVELAKKIIESHGFKANVVPTLSVDNFFEEITQDHIDGYDTEMTSAIRSEDIDKLKELKEKGRQMQCSNRFGESTMHMACRRGSAHIVQFLMDECSCSIRLRDDFGRTPLHDACWTPQAEYEVVRLLIEAEPHLLLTSDKRGHTPLDYVRRESWEAWCRFLNENRDILVPRELLERK